jgi:spore coat polysaccharide biosynthesis protein SpsF
MRTGYFITARLKSSRLKRKILLRLGNQTILDQVIARAKRVHGVDEVVLCTSVNAQDSVLYDYALKHQIKFYMGSEDDVLQRLHGAAHYYGIDGFLSITADNPLHSFYAGDIMLDWARDSGKDYVYPTGLPLGMAPYYLSFPALDVAVTIKDQVDTEIWGPFMNNPDLFAVGELAFDSVQAFQDLRLTCDYARDYQTLQKITAHFGDAYVDLHQLCHACQTLQALAENSDMTQQALDPALIEQIQERYAQVAQSVQQTIRARHYEFRAGFERKAVALL